MAGLSGLRPVLALPIFPGRLQPSIVGRSELNFRVRNGNGWTLALISTNFLQQQKVYSLLHRLSSPIFKDLDLEAIIRSLPTLNP